MKAIEINNLTKDYNGRGIFDLSLSVEEGEVYALVGTNGSGKTTTIRNMMGFINPTSGNILINGLDSYDYQTEIRKIVGYVPGDIAFPDLGTGETFLKMMASALKITDMTRTNKLIDLFKLDIKVPLRRMSKGMKQKTALVACFMTDADIYILDEPTTGLDPLMVDVFIELIKLEKSRGKTVFMSSHIFKEIEALCDSCAIIDNGRLVAVEKRSSFYKDYEQVFQFEFKSKKDFEVFKDYKYSFIKLDADCSQVKLKIKKSHLNQLLKDLSNFELIYFKERPYTMSHYFEKLFKNMEETQNV